MPAGPQDNPSLSATAGMSWSGDAYAKDVLYAASRGMYAAGAVVERRIKLNLNRPGTPPSKKGLRNLRQGLGNLFRAAGDVKRALETYGVNKTRRRNIENAATIRDLGGLIDPPGGMPRKRTGQLQKSIMNLQGEDILTREIGSNIVYAAVHEYGSLDGNTPARPYMRPSLEQSKADAFAAFTKAAADTLGYKK